MLRLEQLNIQENLPQLLKNVNSQVKIPAKISDLIRKIENKFDKANTEELKEILPLCERGRDSNRKSLFKTWNFFK